MAGCAAVADGVAAEGAGVAAGVATGVTVGVGLVATVGVAATIGPVGDGVVEPHPATMTRRATGSSDSARRVFML